MLSIYVQLVQLTCKEICNLGIISSFSANYMYIEPIKQKMHSSDISLVIYTFPIMINIVLLCVVDIKAQCCGR